MACIGFAQSAAKLGKLQHGSLSRKQALNLRLASIRCEAPQSNGNKPSSHAASTSERSRSANWDRKSDIYVLRSDGYSCNRETVTGKNKQTAAFMSIIAINSYYYTPFIEVLQQKAA